MTKTEAWDLISECIDHGYESSELEEMAEYIEQFEQAYTIVEQEMSNET